MVADASGLHRLEMLRIPEHGDWHLDSTYKRRYEHQTICEMRGQLLDGAPKNAIVAHSSGEAWCPGKLRIVKSMCRLDGLETMKIPQHAQDGCRGGIWPVAFADVMMAHDAADVWTLVETRLQCSDRRGHRCRFTSGIAAEAVTGRWPSRMPLSRMMLRMPMRMASPSPPPRGSPASASRASWRHPGSWAPLA